MIQKWVEAARQAQRDRFAGAPKGSRETSHSADGQSVISNVDMRVGEIGRFRTLDEAGERLVRAAMGQMNLSARGYHRVSKLARTIADLAGSENIQAAHLAEALQ